MFKQFRPCFAIGLFLAIAGCTKTPSPSAPQAAGDTSASPSDEPTAAVTSPPPAIELADLPEPDGEDGKYSVAQVMQLAHKSRLYRELFRVPVDPNVAERLTLLYSGLPSQSPPEGDDDSWIERSTALVESAEKIIAGDAESIPAFKKAVNCNSCHNRHR
ncbi:MAG: hypothetical protein AAFU85_08525 [Planctomycetota bacterium]